MKRRWVRVVLAGVLVFAVLCPAAVALWLRVQYAGEPSVDARTRGRDAVWLGHAWVDGRKSDADIAVLAARLKGTGMRDLYVHTGPLEHDGTLPAAVHPRARWFVDAVHRAMPTVRVQSWLGDVVTPEKRPGLDLEDPAARARVVAASGRMLDLGFDGIHFDFEPVRSGSPGFLAVLDEVRALTEPRQKLLSIATPQIDPLPSVHRVGIALAGQGKYWSQAYFAETARRVNQVAVMSYDTAMPLESLYGGFVARQTALALEATGEEVDLLMGLPAYWKDDFGHRGSAETVEAAVRGARLGLTRHAPTRQTFGLALYVDFTATPAHWTAYTEGWSSNT
ncbi:hypothetical protein [Kribbella deserti]|uniref:GH18 domain-containing protein n=1 Tax=Kribbella deserti TaxID=1926257 RepID=A0ABV6QTR7_9ACTN